MRRAASLLLLGVAACAPRASTGGPPATQEDLVFTRYSPLSRNAEIARRTLPPLTFRAISGAVAAAAPVHGEQPIDLARERFSVYVPAGPAPEGGYGLLVFVSPGEELVRPRRWRPPLDRHGLVFVSAARAGNEEKVLDRRLPLVLLAYENVRARYPIDPERVYVGGLSGGSRVAQVAALAYPDVFRGALLNAGSDPIGGEEGIYLPPADLFRKSQRTRLVFVTGERDREALDQDAVARASLQRHCVLDVDIVKAWRLGHEALDPASLERALEALDARAPPDPAELERCNARLEKELAAALAAARAALERGELDRVRAQLKAIDARFGGLAAPAILELADALAARRARP